MIPIRTSSGKKPTEYDRLSSDSLDGDMAPGFQVPRIPGSKIGSIQGRVTALFDSQTLLGQSR